MGKHTPPVADRPGWTLRGLQHAVEQDLLQAGFPSDDDLDRRAGLDEVFSLKDAPRLLAKREKYGLSAQDIAELLVHGSLNPDDHGIDEVGLVSLLDEGFPHGRRRSCN
jgi:hypothetical protein